ncbi:tRNA glutamyl-Q(34) synthetase GluQRS [Pigmentiphaga aceris]|uniref:Glutamyl-Q tRNA(Asp) synthetase n=1 Tax=Pigmentiphaga aceris TaxID=1940612 RepID=A0A5C0B0H4_9BURK|nr:tRNA glutamyl-Q(34) synthetase GluQRS [Pigmentiphaga aceris]QEI07456.1 tRNA glutamyl-Q(34) synthetase GluQRS [Pigmentiphaga aceris]
MSTPASYIGRFAPSPTGALHAGSLVAAMASLLDARARQGTWLLRIEDLDTPRVVPDSDRQIMAQLTALGMHWDGDVVYQSTRDAAYQAAFDQLIAAGHIYGCACTRKEIADSLMSSRGALPVGELPYPGTCRHGLPAGRSARAWRLRVPDGVHCFNDRWVGEQCQDVAREVGDFVLRRADGLWAYQLAVVVDDAWQGITDIVRGADLLGSTARQRVLQELLGLPLPQMMHVPVVTNELGQKLSKQTGATALDLDNPLRTLQNAWSALGFSPLPAQNLPDFWTSATRQWAQRFVPAHGQSAL